MTAEASYIRGKQHPYLRFWNAFGRLLGDRDLPWTVLDAEKLIEKSRQSVGFRDFESNDFLAPFRLLVEGAREEGRLTYVGKVLIHAQFVTGLRERLLRERAVADHPEILDQPIKRPLMIVGAPRTGTTLLNHLLSQDPGGRPLLGWEALRAAPRRRRQKRGAKPRLTLMSMALHQRVLKRVAPDLTKMHPFAYDMPDECHWLLFPSFVWLPGMALPSMRRWFLSQSDDIFDSAYQDYRLALQILEWQRPAPDHWVLKSPLHLWSLAAALRALPEANFIQTHRSMGKVISSFCSVAAVLITLLSDALEPEKMGEPAMEIAKQAVERFTRAREGENASRIEDVLYTDLIEDPIAVVRRIYDRFGYEYTPEFERKLQTFLAEQKRSGVPKHRYTLEQFGLNNDAVAEAFAPYHQAFGINGDA